MDLGLAGRACVVTGASRGIGRAVAELLESEGAKVLGVSRSGGGGTLALDVTDPDVGDRLVGECEERFGRIDVLVNNAGVARARPLEALADADWQEQWDLHVMAPMRLMRAFAPRMAERGGGRIVNVASSSGKRPSASLDAAYSVTKAAQLSLSRVFADRFAGQGVLVNAVLPGPVETPLWTAEGGLADELAQRSGRTRDEVLAATREKAPSGRMSTEDEVAAVIVFLCSARASNVAGAAWAVDGGSVPLIS